MDAVEGEQQKVRSLLDDPTISAFKKYQLLTVGRVGLWGWFKYEFVQWFSMWVPGMVGYALRRVMVPWIVKECGRGVMIGRNCVFRGASRISLGRGVMLDDNVVLDAKGEAASVVLGEKVLIARNSIVRSRGEAILVGDHTDIGSNCIVSTDSRLDIGQEVLVAAYAYICAGGNHRVDDPTRSILRQGFDKQGGVTIGDGAWIGSHAMIMDGARVGAGCVIGSHAVVKGAIPAMAIAVGTPAKVIKSRPGVAES